LAVAWAETLFLLTPSIFLIEEKENNAKNKNKSICRKTIQKNRNRQNHFFKVTRESYFNQKNHQTEKIFEKKLLY
jgi:hypothetical protein